jgi:hypothetical protein
MTSYPKNLEVRGDYSSSGIWTRRAAGLLRGTMLSHGELDLPEELAARFTEWLKRHDLHGRKSGFDVLTFDAMGATLTRDLQTLVGPLTRVDYAPASGHPRELGLSIFRRISSWFRHRP